MANDFVRSIRNVRNVKKQPLSTNEQNDLLSDKNGRVYVRSLDKYFRITGIEDLQKQLDEKLSDKETELVQELRDKLDETEKKYSSVKGTQTKHNNRIKELEACCKDAKAFMENIEYIDPKAREDVKGLKNTVSKLEKTIKGLSNQDPQAREDIEDIQQSLKILSNKISNIKGLDKDTEQKLEQIVTQDDLEGIKSQIEDVANQSDVDQVKKDIETLNGQSEEQKQKITELQDQLKGLEDVPTNEDIEQIKSKIDDLNPNELLKSEDTNNWQKHKFTSNDGTRQYIKKSDFDHIDNLNAGFYETVADPNRNQGLPDEIGNAYIQIDVYTSDNPDRRQYLLYESYTGCRYIKAKHNKDGTEVWKKIITDYVEVLSGIDLQDKNSLLKAPTGVSYVTGAKNKTDEMSTNNGWLTIWNTENIRRIEFQPYSHARKFYNYIYEDKLNEWEFVPNNKDIDNVFNSLTSRYNDLAKSINDINGINE